MKFHAAEVCGEREIDYSFISNEQSTEAMLDMRQRKNIYLIYKEALHNSVKYAECSKIIIQFCRTDYELRLVVEDNGKGFDQLNAKEGNGLSSMRRRAKEIHALLEIQSSRERGTAVILTSKLT